MPNRFGTCTVVLMRFQQCLLLIVVLFSDLDHPRGPFETGFQQSRMDPSDALTKIELQCASNGFIPV